MRKIIHKLELNWRDTAVTVGMLGLAGLSSALLHSRSENDAYVTMLFFLAVFLISRLTDGYFYGTVASLASVVGVNYIFTYPYMKLDFTRAGYPLTFMTMIAVSIITCTMTSQLKEKEQVKAEAEREKMRGNLLRAVSHDLRTPLTSIIGSAELLLTEDGVQGSMSRRELIAGISKDADWLLRMVENMLSITRLEDGGAKLHLQAELPEEIIGAAAAKFKKWHPGHRLVVRFPEEVLMAMMDGVLIEQVILNFLDNAARHAGSSDEILLECGREGQEVFFRVTDHGRGIDPAEIENLFSDKPGRRPLMRKETGRSDNHRGMGIGLSVCRTIIRAHKGQIGAHNHPQGGAVFQFTLPLLEVEHE